MSWNSQSMGIGVCKRKTQDTVLTVASACFELKQPCFYFTPCVGVILGVDWRVKDFGCTMHSTDLYVQGGSNMTGSDCFTKKHNCHVNLQRTPLRSQHIFSQRSGSILMPFSKNGFGWRGMQSRTVWMTALSANRMPCKSDLRLGAKSGLYGGCGRMFHFKFRRVSCFGRIGACIVLKEGYPLSTCLPLGSDLFLHVCCQSQKNVAITHRWSL
jgi:hypothetical protein